MNYNLLFYVHCTLYSVNCTPWCTYANICTYANYCTNCTKYPEIIFT